MSVLALFGFASRSLSIKKTDCIKNLILICVLDINSGSGIEDFIAALKIQNIMPEITLEKNITSLPQHNGAIKISLEGKVKNVILFFCPVRQ